MKKCLHNPYSQPLFLTAYLLNLQRNSRDCQPITGKKILSSLYLNRKCIFIPNILTLFICCGNKKRFVTEEFSKPMRCPSSGCPHLQNPCLLPGKYNVIRENENAAPFNALTNYKVMTVFQKRIRFVFHCDSKEKQTQKQMSISSGPVGKVRGCYFYRTFLY